MENTAHKASSATQSVNCNLKHFMMKSIKNISEKSNISFTIGRHLIFIHQQG